MLKSLQMFHLQEFFDIFGGTLKTETIINLETTNQLCMIS